MMEFEGGILVGVLGQWASGKSTAASTLVEYLGGEGEVAFIDDRELCAGQVVKYLLELDDSQVTCSIDDDGARRLDGEHATVWLEPREDLKTADLSTVRWAVHEEVFPAWLNRARVEVGTQICERLADGKPIVVEAGFGKNPPDHAIADLFVALGEAGVRPEHVKWILVEANYDKRAERNEKRHLDDTDITGPPADVFARYAADGGDLDPEHQARLEEQGTVTKRVANDHDDLERFRADVIAAFEEMFGDVLPARMIDGRREAG
jgi:hypothetical protein